MLTPEEYAAVKTLTGMLASKPTDTPPWGTSHWAFYVDKIWSGPSTSDPSPIGPVTHIQLSKVASFIRTEITQLTKLVEQIESGNGLTEGDVKGIIAKTKLTP